MYMNLFSPGPGQHMPFDPSAARMPCPQDSTPRHQFPPRMYTPMNQGQVEGAPVGPHPQMPYQPGKYRSLYNKRQL